MQGNQRLYSPCQLLDHCGNPNQNKTSGLELCCLRTLSLSGNLKREDWTGRFDGLHLHEGEDGKEKMPEDTVLQLSSLGVSTRDPTEGANHNTAATAQ
ncbi:hypothetical protein Y1Q_0000572 [Alligator mississippiensis]|uniref:Uncharacterized protein n=1 Tax=Alligator mississippiensis TaxID=8496 RepID=A0A151MBP0_ALLMI|nr:hypothetical protein Y1Q_0000572 [Alligator mississippiensis]